MRPTMQKFGVHGCFGRQPLPVGDKPASVLTADFDGNGKPDLAVLNEAGLHVLLNDR